MQNLMSLINKLLGLEELANEYIKTIYYIGGAEILPSPLKPHEEAELISQLGSAGDLNAKAVLIERNLRLVVYIARKFENTGVNVEDLISIGTIGLIKAITTYKPGKGTKLATYAARCIDNEILMFIRAAKKFNNDVYLQEPIGIDKEGHEIRVEDKIADEILNIDDQVNLKIQVKLLYEKMRKVLKGREKAVIEMRYGLLTGEEVTQREIADLLGISRSYVSRIEKKALSKLSREMQA